MIKKIGDFIAFLFLSSLIFSNGFFWISVQRSWGQGAISPTRTAAPGTIESLPGSDTAVLNTNTNTANADTANVTLDDASNAANSDPLFDNGNASADIHVLESDIPDETVARAVDDDDINVDDSTTTSPALTVDNRGDGLPDYSSKFPTTTPESLRDMDSVVPSDIPEARVTTDSLNDHIETSSPALSTDDTDQTTAVIPVKPVASVVTDDCRAANITLPEVCSAWQAMERDGQCFSLGLYTNEACEQYKRRLYLTDACQEQKLANAAECRSYLLDHYRNEIDCGTMTEAQCQQTVGDNFLGQLIANVKGRDALDQELRGLPGHRTTLVRLGQLVVSAKRNVPEIMSLAVSDSQSGQAVTLLSSESKSVIDQETSTLTTSLPSVMVIDSDQDGVPDEMEDFFATDKSKGDSDRDGYLDGEEIAHGYNPMGAGVLNRDLAPAVSAVIKARVLQQPIVSGQSDNKMQVTSARQENGSGGFYFEGRAAPGSVALLYLYSQLPLVTAVQTNDQGNWNYTMNWKLADGQHSMYVASVDSGGKIVVRSQPLPFLVSAGKLTQAEALVPAVSSLTVDSSVFLSREAIFYIIIIFLAAAFILTVAVVLYRIRKSQRPYFGA